MILWGGNSHDEEMCEINLLCGKLISLKKYLGDKL
jgi:hypothetical protein